MTANPGQTTSIVPFQITVGSSDGSGYALTEGLTQQFGSLPNTDWSTDQWAQVGTLPNGSESFALTDPSYDAAGDALTLFSTNTVSGSTGSTSTGAVPNAYPYSPDGTHDVFTTILHLTLPANQPGSPNGGYSGSFDYMVTGN